MRFEEGTGKAMLPVTFPAGQYPINFQESQLPHRSVPMDIEASRREGMMYGNGDKIIFNQIRLLASTHDSPRYHPHNDDRTSTPPSTMPPSHTSTKPVETATSLPQAYSCNDASPPTRSSSKSKSSTLECATSASPSKKRYPFSVRS